MSITIYAVPKFELELKIVPVEALMSLAENHYDGTCRSIAALGGFLYGWQVAKDSGCTHVTGSWRELDLLLKVCESIHQAPLTDRSTVRAFQLSVVNAMNKSTELNPIKLIP